MIDFLLGFFWSGEKKPDAPTGARYMLATIIFAALGALYLLNRN